MTEEEHKRWREDHKWEHWGALACIVVTLLSGYWLVYLVWHLKDLIP